MSTLVELLRESVLIQAMITLIVVTGVVYLYTSGKPVPQELWSLVSLIVGFYFGSKVERQAQALARKVEEAYAARGPDRTG